MGKNSPRKKGLRAVSPLLQRTQILSCRGYEISKTVSQRTRWSNKRKKVGDILNGSIQELLIRLDKLDDTFQSTIMQVNEFLRQEVDTLSVELKAARDANRKLMLQMASIQSKIDTMRIEKIETN